MNPGKLSYASPGIASAQHMLGESIREKAGAVMVHIPYRGGAQITTDLMAGMVDAGFLTVSGMLANMAGNKLKPLAVTSPTRVAQLPDHGRIHRPQERHRGIRQDDRSSDPQHAAVGQRRRRGGGHPTGPAGGIRKWPVACANRRLRLSCQASTWTDA